MPRPKKWQKQNEEETIEFITYQAVAEPDLRRKTKLLRQLNGVDFRVASVILHFAEPDKYMIMDRRALWSLGWGHPSDSVGLLSRYMQRARQLLSELHLPLRTIDKALWEYSDRYEPR